MTQLKFNMFRLSLTALIALSLSGCMLAPGMNMNENDLTPSVNANGHIVTPSIIPITAELILQQEKEAEIQTELAIRNYVPPKGFTSDPVGYQYRIGPQDDITVTIWNYQMLTSPIGTAANGSASVGGASGNIIVPLEVDSNGNIYYPYLGYIHIAGKTIEEGRLLMTQKLSAMYNDPQVTIDVTTYHSQYVTVTGAVTLPVVLPISNTPLTVLDAIIKSQVKECSIGSSQNLCADTNNVQVSQNGVTTTVNVNTLKSPTGQSTNWILQNNAQIFVPTNKNTIFMLGAVNGAGPLNMGNGTMTLEEAIGQVGGVSVGSNPKYTYVIRNYQRDPQIFYLNANSPDALNLAGEFLMKPEDVVFVSNSKLETANEILGQINPTLQSGLFIYGLSTR